MIIMTREELWSELVNKHPSFGGDGKVTLGAAGLRRLFDLIWNEAEHYGFYSVREDARQDVPAFFQEFFTPKR